MNLSAFKIIPVVLLLSLLTVAGGCNLLGSEDNSAPSINWQEGEIIQPGDEDELSETQLTAYKLDAERLAVRLIRNQDSTQTDIPPTLVDLLYNGLVHIATSSIPKAEQATREYDIHARVPSHPRQVEVWSDTTASWIKAWETGQTQTGNSELDDLLSQFNLELASYEAVDDSVLSRALLESDQVINGFAVGHMLEDLGKIETAGPSPITDGNEINVLFFNDRLRYFFERRFGDCSADSGCPKTHSWVFDVHKNGGVSFIGEQGDPL